jgi:hypothetical protein
MATKEEGLRAALEQAQSIAKKARANASNGPSELVGYWTQMADDADRDVRRLTLELAKASEPACK